MKNELQKERVSKIGNIDVDIVLSPVGHHAIVCADVDILTDGLLRANFSEIRKQGK